MSSNAGSRNRRTPLSRTADLGGQLELVVHEIETRFDGTDLTIQPTGYGVLMAQTERRLASTPEAALAVQGAVAEVGPQITLTSLVIIGSMVILTLGSFAPGVHFRTITLIIVLVALLADLLILPRLLCVVHKKRWRLRRSAS